MKSVDIVDFRDTLGANLVTAIVKVGYEPATSFGLPVSAQGLAENYDGCVGLLLQDPRDEPERYFFGLFKRPARRRLVAVIWTDNFTRKATPKRWVVETWGRENLSMVTEAIECLAVQFRAKASIQLESDRPKYEMKLSDFDM
jgi:hypothetical protein